MTNTDGGTIAPRQVNRGTVPPAARPHVLFLNRSYWPDSEATGQLLTALCEGLADDFDVHVLAGMPNSASEADWSETTSRNGVTIHRVAHTTFSKRSTLLKAVNFLSFARAVRAHLRAVPVPDIVVFETDPFLLAFVADRLHRRTGCQMIGYLQDIYPDVAVALGKVSNNWLVRRLRTALFDVYRRCDRMIVLSRDMRNLLHDSRVDPANIEIIPNWADTQAIRPIESGNLFRSRHRLDDKFVVMYSGNLGLTQRLEEFIEAADLLRDDAQIQFVFVGQGARRNELQELADKHGLSNVLFCDYQPLQELSHSLSAADLHLVPLTAALTGCLMPSKVYGILAAGRPFLTNAPPGSELHAVAVEENTGVAVEPGSAARIATVIRELKANPARLRDSGHNARQLAESHYTKSHAITAFKRLLKTVVAASSEMREASSTLPTSP